MQKCKRFLLCGCSLIGLVASQSQMNITTAAEDSDFNFEEILITAERRAVSEQDMAVSVVALSGDVLKSRGVQTLEQLQYQVPSLTFTDNGNTKYLNIRGVGLSESAPNQTTGVAVHLDGAYVAREFVYGDAFFDLESVEILRGPQGTYTGQNASGGAIFINSRKPKLGETGGFVDVEYGSFNHMRGGAGIDIPLTETLAARFSGEFEKRDSYYNNHGANLADSADVIENQPGNLHRFLGRFQLLYSPSEDLEFRLIHQTSDSRTDGVTNQFYPTMGSTELPTTGIRDLNYDLDGHINIRYDRTTAMASWDATDTFRVLANFSHHTTHQSLLSDNDLGSPLTSPTDIQEASNFVITDEYWTGEVNLVSTSESAFEWTIGASMLDFDQKNTLNLIEYNSARFPGTGYDPAVHTRLFLYLNSVRKNQAVFAEVGYQFTPTVQLKVGARYNHDEVGFAPESYLGFSYNAAGGVSLAPPILTFNEWTGRALLNWQPNDNTLVYATVSRGYKPGGTTPFGADYESEFVLNKEIGVKMTMLDGKLRSSISAFSMDYDNFQRTYSEDPNNANPATATTKNVDGSTIKGIEAQLSGDIGALTWDVSFAYNDGKYGTLELAVPAGAADGVNPTTAEIINIEGRSIDFLPKTSLNLGLSYYGIALSKGRIIPSVRMSYQASYYTSFFQQDYSNVPAKTLFDASVAYEAENDWRLEVYAKNAADNLYISRSNGTVQAPGTYSLGAPREFGVRLGYKFGG